MPATRHWWLIAGSLLVAAVWGAWQLRFLCDDAYITFRYVSNAHDGLGLVWNPPPFRPVEGYTSFAWALLLWATWSWTGIEPPDAANVLSIACGALQFLVLVGAARRLRRRDGGRAPTCVVALTLAAIVGNRTFLQWLTSGLETALFNLAFVTWVLVAFRGPERRTGWWLAWAGAAALAALARPDGMLLVAATVAVAGITLLRRQRTPAQLLLGLLPLAAVAAHLLWRHDFYGEWVPNTYYAKVVAAWPEAGVRYFACFALEHGVWLWLPLAALWLVVEARRAGHALPRLLWDRLPALAAIGATLCQCGYYVFVVGGDHFEYRVFSQLVPLGVLAAAAMSLRLWSRTSLPVLALTCLWLASGVGWLHLALTRQMPLHGFVPVAPQLPAAVQPIARWYDRQQAWLMFRLIGLRCNHHALVLQRFERDFPRRLHVVAPPDAFPVYATGAAGRRGWCLPDCVLLDTQGLNDWVVARTPVRPPEQPVSSARFRPVVAAADRDHDGLIDAGELRAALASLRGGVADDEAADYVVLVMMAMFAREHVDALTLAEADGIGDALAGVRQMAHERHPPPGYVEAFEPNVQVDNGIATATPRAVPLDAERVRRIEAEWREKVRAGLGH